MDEQTQLIPYALKLYGTGVLATCMHTAYDFLRYNLPRIRRGDVAQALKVKRYQVMIKGKPKRLTLAGEIHCYNKNDSDLAEKLIEEHSSFASEGGNEDGGRNEMSFGNSIYLAGISLLFLPPVGFYKLGSGRWCPSMRDIHEKKGHEVHSLERDPMIFMSPVDKLQFFGKALLGALLFPLCYYKGKQELKYGPETLRNPLEGSRLKKPLVDDRDEVMANSLVELLERNDIDDLLANTGGAHLNGVIRNLSMQVQLREVE